MSSKVISQNIHYQLTKQRTHQSMHSKGALHSYERLDQFLRKHTVGLSYRNAYLEYYTWATDKEAVQQANDLETQFLTDFGEPYDKPLHGYGTPSAPHYNRNFSWQLAGNVEQHLEYIDDLGKLPKLTPRPPVEILVRADFWMLGVEQSDTMSSDVYAWLSPTSNKACFLFNFPHATIDDNFIRYREKLQADCHVKLEDKYFYTRKISSTGNQTLRKALK